MPTPPRKIGPKTPQIGSLVVHLIKALSAPPQDRCVDSLTIRAMRGQPDDFGRDVDAWLAVQNEAFRAGSRPWGRSDFERQLARRNWFRSDQLWLAYPESALGHAEPGSAQPPVGTIALELRAGSTMSGRIHWLAVRREWRRRGIGRMLVRRLERECWEQGAERVVLETLGSWDKVIHFYQSLGYQPHHGAERQLWNEEE